MLITNCDKLPNIITYRPGITFCDTSNKLDITICDLKFVSHCFLLISTIGLTLWLSWLRHSLRSQIVTLKNLFISYRLDGCYFQCYE